MSLIERVVKIAEEITAPTTHSGITAATTLGEGLAMDELLRLEFVMAVEEDFDVDIDDGDAEKFVTIGDVVAHLEAIGCQ